MLSIIIPTFQEEKSIYNTLEIINKKLIQEKIQFEILVIDDNSNDKTEKVVSIFQKFIQIFIFI